MADTEDHFDRLMRIQWLAHIGSPEPTADVVGSMPEITRLVETDPDRFFEPPYTGPYEGRCVEDHDAAAKIEAVSVETRSKAVARHAYLASWEHLPHPEVCGLISDDAKTIAILLLNGESLHPFTQERLAWYEQGRAPWGYTGTYPAGRWLIL